MSHEDIRRSLDVLDSVLAEFDDCLESWDTPFHLEASSDRKLEFTDFNSNAVKTKSEAQLCCPNSPKDGGTSHLSSSIVPEQPRISSPPPIPKRSPATKLSEVSCFPFNTDENSLPDSSDPTLSDLSSNHVQIKEPLSSVSSDNKCSSDKCASCGRGLKQNAMEKTTDEASSPFQHRKQMFEAKIAEANSKSPSLSRSSFKKQLETSSEFSINSSSGDSGFENGSLRSNFSEISATESPSSISLTSNGRHHGLKCTCKDRIRKLDAKFADIRRLLKLKKIRGLNSKPPNFIPPPPPTSHRLKSSSREDLIRDTKFNRDILPKTSTNNGSSFDISQKGPRLSMSGSMSSLTTSTTDFKQLPALCNRCSSSLSVHTSEDLTRLLPTDALNRPHLGFSYSMEEDLPPGVKEIQQTSTPKRDVSSPKLFRGKESNLSTFSHSASSLGYISSQSDLELNDLSTVPDKVPMSSFKSRTLPNGLDRSPFYSASDDMFNKGEENDYNDNRLKSHHKSVILDCEKRSFSPPLAPESEKTKTKHFRVFSRKTKKDKKKNGDTP